MALRRAARTIAAAARAASGISDAFSERVEDVFGEPGPEITLPTLRPGEYSPGTAFMRLAVSVASEARARANVREKLRRQRAEEELTGLRAARLRQQIAEGPRPEKPMMDVTFGEETFTVPHDVALRERRLQAALRLSREREGRIKSGLTERSNLVSQLTRLDKDVDSLMQQKAPQIDREVGAALHQVKEGLAVLRGELNVRPQRRAIVVRRMEKILPRLNLGEYSADRFAKLKPEDANALLSAAAKDLRSRMENVHRRAAIESQAPLRRSIMSRLTGSPGVEGAGALEMSPEEDREFMEIIRSLEEFE